MSEAPMHPSFKKLEDLPYVSHVPADGRAMMLQPWFNHGEAAWHLYCEVNPGEFLRMQVQGIHSGLYLSAQPQDPADWEFKLGTLVAQNLSFPKVSQPLYCIVDDLHMLAATLEKIELLKKGVPQRFCH
jgi:hypothetical protein